MLLIDELELICGDEVEAVLLLGDELWDASLELALDVVVELKLESVDEGDAADEDEDVDGEELLVLALLENGLP